MGDLQLFDTPNFECKVCDYITSIKDNYDKHILTAKHNLLTKAPNSTVLECTACDYITVRKSSYDKHLATAKHKIKLQEAQSCEKSCDEKLTCPNCKKTYNSRPGLWSHKKKCLSETDSQAVRSDKDDIRAEPPLENTIVLTISEVPNSTDNEPEKESKSQSGSNPAGTGTVFMKLFKENHDFKNLLVEQQRENSMLMNRMVEKDEVMQRVIKTLLEEKSQETRETKDLMNKIVEITQQQLAVTTTINNNNTVNNNNQRFNLNVFLNETCKDAMNLQEFLDGIRPTFEELLVMGDVGFVDGISEIFIKRLRELDITKRPIHCTDFKRETIFLKENNVWTKDDNGHAKLKSIIEKVEYRNVVTLHTWCIENPEAMINNHEKNLLRDKIYLQTLLGDPKTRDKVVKIIAREVTLDREAIMLQIRRG